MENENVHVCSHPLVAHKLTILRDKNTKPKQVRELLYELSTLLGYEATKTLALKEKRVETPLSAAAVGSEISERVYVAPILRAGLGLVEGILHLIPSAAVVHLGLYRDKFTLQPVEYYNRLPQECNADRCIIVDPMVATAGTAIAAVNILKDWGVKPDHISLVCIIASVRGIEALMKAHPYISVFVGCVDQELDSHGYILPGLGDAGDRQFKFATT